MEISIERLQELITRSHLEGQAHVGTGQNYASALMYFEKLVKNLNEETETKPHDQTCQCKPCREYRLRNR